VVGDRSLIGRWPEQLIERISSKSFVLVVGAGISRSCQNSSGRQPPSWSALVADLTNTFTSGATKKFVRDLVAQERYLDAAEFLRSRARKQAKEQDFLQKIADVTDGGKKTKDQFQPSELHEILLRLEPDVLLTTNYDRILERATNNGYNLHSYDSTTLASDVRLGTPVLVKVHGSVDSSSKIVLTRSDYARLRREGSEVLEVLQALFLTKTALFVGYSFSDPDIHLLLENVLGARGDVPAHYLLTSNRIPAHQREIYKYCYGTDAVTFAQSNFAEMQRMLELLGEAVEARR
jgi:hypothetical protein